MTLAKLHTQVAQTLGGEPITPGGEVLDNEEMLYRVDEALRRMLDVAGAKTEIDGLWAEYVTQSAEEGAPVSVEDFGVFLVETGGEQERDDRSQA